MSGFMPVHAGPSSYRPSNSPSKPSRGRKGPDEGGSAGQAMARTHEAKARKPKRKKGHGKIKSTGAPRFTRHTKF